LVIKVEEVRKIKEFAFLKVKRHLKKQLNNHKIIIKRKKRRKGMKLKYKKNLKYNRNKMIKNKI